MLKERERVIKGKGSIGQTTVGLWASGLRPYYKNGNQEWHEEIKQCRFNDPLFPVELQRIIDWIK